MITLYGECALISDRHVQSSSCWVVQDIAMYLKHDVIQLYGFSYGLASASAGRYRLAKIENKFDNITRTVTSFNKLKHYFFYSTPANPGSMHP